jgi:hypothetical protein
MVDASINHPYRGFVNLDGLVKSTLSRHPGESRGPVVLGIPGFRLPPE